MRVDLLWFSAVSLFILFAATVPEITVSSCSRENARRLVSRISGFVCVVFFIIYYYTSTSATWPRCRDFQTVNAQSVNRDDQSRAT